MNTQKWLHREVLYEIAMTIGGDLDELQTLDRFLPVFLRRLGGTSAGIFQVVGDQDGPRYQAVRTLPRKSGSLEAIERIPLPPSRLPFTFALNADSTIKQYGWCLPGYGVLLLTHRELPENLVREIDQLAQKLAVSLLACRQHAELRTTRAELERHRGHLEELVQVRTRELEQERNRAEAATIAKTAFLTNMSHEIRTPLNAITGMVQHIRRNGATEEQLSRLDKIDAASQHLLEVLNSILDLSKIQAGKLTLEAQEVNLAQLMENVSLMVRDKAESKGLLLNEDWSSLPSTVFRGDRVRIKQCLLNYANNAIKFTPTGSITLSASLAEQSESTALVRFEVIDTGIGVPVENQSRLFDDFEQVDNSTSRKYGGTGLGLAITRKLAHLMGGQAGMTSTVNAGSAFWFTARLEKIQHPQAANESAFEESAETVLLREYAGSRILLAEDDAVNREVALLYLEDVHLEVDVAEDGVQAVALAKTRTYDLVLMDMLMPSMDGLEATRALRRLSKGHNVPIVAMTANAFAEDRERCLKAGMDDFVSKPFNPDHFFEIILKWLSKARAIPTGATLP